MHSLKDVLWNPFVHSLIQLQGKILQGTTETEQSCLSAVMAIRYNLPPRNLHDSAKKDEANGFFLKKIGLLLV